MELILISPTHQEIFSIVWLEVTTPVGNFIIQPGHAPMIVTLRNDHEIMFRLASGKSQTRVIKTGALHVTPTKATIIMA